MSQNEPKFCQNQKFWKKKYFIGFNELLLKFWTKFAQLLSIYDGINES